MKYLFTLKISIILIFVFSNDLNAQTTLGSLTTSSSSCKLTFTPCEGDTLEFSPTNTTDFTNFKWYYGSIASANEITGVSPSQNVIYKSGSTIRIVNTGGVYIMTGDYTTPSGCAAINDTIEVNFNPRPTANSTTTSLCESTSGGNQASFNLTALVATITGGAAGVTTTFHTSLADANSGSNAISMPNSYVSGTTTVYARVQNNSTNCYKTTSISLTVHPKPLIADASTTICNGTTINLTSLITSYVTYSNPVWTLTTVGGTAVATPTAVTPTVTTTYVLVAENSNGCKDTANIIVNVNPLPTVTDPTDQVVCNGATTTAVAFTGTVTGTTYAWTNNTTSIGLAASGSGDIAAFTATNTGTSPVTATITVTPTANTCVGTAQTFTITVNPTDAITAGGANPTTCTGTDGTITISGLVNSTSYTVNYTGTAGTPTSGGTATSNGSGQITITGLSAGSYTNISVSRNSCPSNTVASVTLSDPSAPSVTDPTDQVVCNATSTTAVTFSGTSGATFNWTNNTPSIGLAASGSGNIAAFTATNTGTSPVTATITVTPTLAGCTGTAQTFTITVNPKPVIADASTTICDGTTVDLTSLITNYNSYSNPIWSMGTVGGTVVSTPTMVTTSSTMTFVLVAENSNSCKDTANVIVTVNPKPDFTLAKPVACPGTSEEVTIMNLTGASTATATYKVDAGSYLVYPTPANITGLSVGSHTITVKNIEGCETSKPITINAIVPRVCIPVTVIRVN